MWYLNELFSHLSGGKIKEVVFVGLDIRRLNNDKNSEKNMKSFEKDAWISLEDGTQQFLEITMTINTRGSLKKYLKIFKN